MALRDRSDLKRRSVVRFFYCTVPCCAIGTAMLTTRTLAAAGWFVLCARGLVLFAGAALDHGRLKLHRDADPHRGLTRG